MISSRVAATAALVCVGALAGCSTGHTTGGLGPTTTTPAERAAAFKTQPMDQFCGQLQDLITATAKVGIVTDLAAVRTRLAAATGLADQEATAGTPRGSSTYSTLLALDSDLKVVNAWVQTDATQSDLDHNRQPADVRVHFVDMGARFRSLTDWSSANCQAYGAGGD